MMGGGFFCLAINRRSAHLRDFFQMLLGGQKLLVLEHLFERSESFDAVRLEEGLEIGALRCFFAWRLSSLFLETVCERQLGDIIQSDGGGTSGIGERDDTHFIEALCGDCVECWSWKMRRRRACVRGRST